MAFSVENRAWLYYIYPTPPPPPPPPPQKKQNKKNKKKKLFYEYSLDELNENYIYFSGYKNRDYFTSLFC